MKKLAFIIFPTIFLAVLCFLNPETVLAKECYVGDPSGKDDTIKIQNAINSCAGDGQVVFSSGRTYLTGTIEIKSGVTLKLNGAVLQTTADFSDYRSLKCESCHKMFLGTKKGTGAHNIEIVGPGAIEKGEQSNFSLALIEFLDASDVNVRNIFIDSREAPKTADGFHLVSHESDQIVFDNITIRGGRASGQVWGNDGIDIQNSQHVAVRNCDIDTHDDGIAIATPGSEILEDVLVENCIISNDGGAIKFGTGSVADMKNVTFKNITIHNCLNNAIHFSIYDGGEVSDITLSNITIEDNVYSSFVCGGGAAGLGGMKDCAGPVDRDGDGIKETAGGYIHDIVFQDFEIYSGGDYVNFGESSINNMERVTFKNIHFHSGSGSAPLVRFRDICGLSISGFSSHLTGNPEEDLRIESSVTNLALDGSDPVCGDFPPPPAKGDLNSDGKVDIIDLGILLSNWGSATKPPADLNQDGYVDIIDLGIMLSNWG